MLPANPYTLSQLSTIFGNPFKTLIHNPSVRYDNDFKSFQYSQKQGQIFHRKDTCLAPNKKHYL